MHAILNPWHWNLWKREKSFGPRGETRPRTAWAGLVLMLLAAWLLGACGPLPAGEAGEGGNPDTLRLHLIPPAAGTGLTVYVADAAGMPVTDATVQVEGDMNHAGMAPVIGEPVADEADGAADGFYHIPFQFTMMGDWILTVTVERADGTRLERQLNLRVNDAGVSGDVVAAGQMVVVNAWARPVLVASGTGAIYLTLLNGTGVADRLVSVSSPLAAAELHESIHEGDVMRMEPRPEGFDIPAEGGLVLRPGGKHIMLLNVPEPLEAGDMVEITLEFATAPAQTVQVPVRDMADGSDGMAH